MSEERKMILKMLEDGKISANDAVKLLNVVSNNVENDTKTDTIMTSDSLVNKEVVKKSIEQAKEVSREALQSVKESVQEAIEESKKALRETLYSRKISRNIEAVRQFDESLAEEWENAEEEFEQAKEMMKEVQEINEEIESLKDEIVEHEEDDCCDIAELRNKIRELENLKEDLAKKAQASSEIAQEKILDVRRRCKELNIDFEKDTDFEDNLNQELQNVGNVISKATSQIGPMINDFINGFNIGGFEGHEVIETITWEPESSEENVVLNVNLQNGSIKVFGDDSRSDVFIRLRKKIRAPKESVEKLAKELVSINCAGNIANIEVVRRFNNRHSVSVELYLPTKYLYDCNFKSVNGRVAINDVTGQAWLLNTTNGRIELKDCQANHIQAGSSNGSLRINASAKQLELSATNGSIRYYVPAKASGKVKLYSTNGSIRIYTDKKINAMLNGVSRVGKVRLTDEWQIKSSLKKHVGHTVIAHTLTFDENEPHLNIDAKTTNGSIRVNQEE